MTAWGEEQDRREALSRGREGIERRDREERGRERVTECVCVCVLERETDRREEREVVCIDLKFLVGLLVGEDGASVGGGHGRWQE